MSSVSKQKREQYKELLNILYDFVICFDNYDNMIKLILSDPEEMLLTEADREPDRDKILQIIEKLQGYIYLE